MRKLSLFIMMCVAEFSVAQGLELAPLEYNADLNVAGQKPGSLKSTTTFDSTFVYYPDTLSLPFFDEFTHNHFQVYQKDYNAAGVTSDKKYRMLDPVTSSPIANGQYYTSQATFRRTYDVTTSLYTDTYFSTENFLVGDLSSYPVLYNSLDLYPPYYIYDTIGQADVSDTIWISGPEYYQDSATQFFMNLNDPNAYWLDSYAYHNYRYALNPRSLGVVTFDGLDENGYPYAIGSTTSGYADVLTSKPIDLSGLTTADSVYLSFLYQPEGLGDVPEASDSLILQFYKVQTGEWVNVWSATGSDVTDFKVGNIRLAHYDFFQKGFQFRFRNYGGLSGSLDHFHLDYVHLRTMSGYQDTLFKDFAFCYPVGSLLKDYTSVPWEHYQNNSTGKMNDSLKISVYNGSVITENNQNGLVEVSYGGTTEGSFILNAQTLSGGNINYAPRTTYITYHDLSGGYEFPTNKPGEKEVFDVLVTANAQFPNLAENDSTTGKQYFANYYSYDDSTAEAAIGPTSAQSCLALRFNAYEADSLRALAIHFEPTVNDMSGKLFLITVWDDNNGQPGSIVYQDNAYYPNNPKYPGGRNAFAYYVFTDSVKVPVGTTFYVGFKQLDDGRYNVGLDRNTDHMAQTFYSLNGGASWLVSDIPGTVMIRPIVSTALDYELGVEELEIVQTQVKIYPNPVSSVVTVELENGQFQGAALFSVQGSLVKSIDQLSFSVEDLPSGIYFYRLNGESSTYKIVKY